MSRRGGRLLLAAAASLAVAGLLLSGCGLPEDETPERLEVPSGVFPEPDADESTGADPDADDTSLHWVYFLRDGFLEELQRPLTSPVLLDAPLNNLLEGPTPEEAEIGLESAIPAGTEVVNVQLQRDNVVSIHLNEVFFEMEGVRRVQAVAQLVFTASALARDTQGVRFFLDGEPQALPDGAGTIAQVGPSESPRALQVSDFTELLPLTPFRSIGAR